MYTYIISFTFSLPDKKYKGFFMALEKLGGVKVLSCAYLVKTDMQIEDMRIALLPYLQKKDGLIIASVKGEVAIRNARCSPQTLKELLTGGEN